MVLRAKTKLRLVTRIHRERNTEVYLFPMDIRATDIRLRKEERYLDGHFESKILNIKLYIYKVIVTSTSSALGTRPYILFSLQF